MGFSLRADHSFDTIKEPFTQLKALLGETSGRQAAGRRTFVMFNGPNEAH